MTIDVTYYRDRDDVMDMAGDESLIQPASHMTIYEDQQFVPEIGDDVWLPVVEDGIEGTTAWTVHNRRFFPDKNEVIVYVER